MPALAALAASGLVSIERKRASDATGSLASRSASPVRICSVASAGVPLTSGTGAASITRRYNSCLDPSIQILRIRDGHIVLWRDFADPRILEEVTGEPRLEN